MKSTPKDKILLAGFEKFGPYNYNVAERIVDIFDGKIIEVKNNTRLEIIGLKLPINFDTFRDVLANAISTIQPKIAIWLGMDFKDLDHPSIEFLAHAKPKYGKGIKDANGNDGKTDLLDSLPEIIRLPNTEQIKNIIRNIDNIEISEMAGRHMCETTLRDLIRLSNEGKKFQPLFIHMAHTPELLADSEKLEKHIHAMPIEKQAIVIENIIKRLSMIQ